MTKWMLVFHGAHKTIIKVIGDLKLCDIGRTRKKLAPGNKRGGLAH